MAIANARANGLAIKALCLRDGETVLELGCGSGETLAGLHRRTPRATLIGLDWSPTMIAQARRHNRRALRLGRVELVCGDFARLPFADSMVDAVLATNVAYFMHNADALQEAHRVLRAGGRIVLYSTDRSAMRAWPFAGRRTHRLMSRDRLAALFEAAGFAAKATRIDRVDAGFGVAGLLVKAQKETGQTSAAGEQEQPPYGEAASA